MADLPDAQTLLAARGSPLLALLRFRLKAVRNRLAGVRGDSSLKVAVVGLLGSAFWLGLFFLFIHAFDFLNANAFSFRVTLIRHILSLFFVALLFMLIFSNAVISFQNLFRSQETAFLFSLPLRHDTIFLYKLIESLIFSSWAVFAAGIPLLLAFGIKSQAPWHFYPLVLVFMTPFVLLPAAIGALAGLILTAVVPKHGGKVLAIIALILLGMGAYVAISILNLHSGQTAYNTEMQSAVSSVLSRLGFTQHFMTPNYWITEALLGISEGRPDSLLTGAWLFAALATTSVFFLALGWFLSGAIYVGAYSGASAGDHFRRVTGRTLIERLFKPLSRRHPQIMLLVIKDIKTFLRDPAQWSQVLIFFGILTLYIGNLRNFSYPLHDPFYKNLISFLNLGATCMTLATTTSRFVFPLISLEGRRFWILGLMPLRRRNIMLAKFYFALLGSLLLTTSLILLSNHILSDGENWSVSSDDRFVLGVQLLTGVLISIGLSGLSVGMGAIFPSFAERNPSKIVSGFGGTLTLILAIGLVAFSIIGEGLVCHRYLVPQLKVEGLPAEASSESLAYVVMGGVAALNLLAACIPMKFGIRALENVEF
jgi:ABC-2 type transport system permease protein